MNIALFRSIKSTLIVWNGYQVWTVVRHLKQSIFSPPSNFYCLNSFLCSFSTSILAFFRFDHAFPRQASPSKSLSPIIWFTHQHYRGQVGVLFGVWSDSYPFNRIIYEAFFVLLRDFGGPPPTFIFRSRFRIAPLVVGDKVWFWGSRAGGLQLQ